MRLDETVTRSTIPSPVKQTGETGMMQRERWEEVRRLFYCIRSESWQPYWREGRADTLLGEHADFLRQRAPQVNYSARILYQELSRGARLQGQLRHGEALRAAIAGRWQCSRAGAPTL